MPDARIRLIEDKARLGTWTFDVETHEVFWSAGIFRILGLSEGAVLPSLDLYQQMVHPDDQIVFTDAMGLAGDPRIEGRRFRVIRSDGSLCWLESRAQKHLDRNGKPILISGVVADVTREETLRIELERKQRQERLLHDLLGEFVWRARPDGRLIDTSKWTEITGETPSEAHNWERLEAIHPDDREAFREAWRVAIAGGESFVCTARVRYRDGHFERLSSKALPFKDDNGEIKYWFGATTVASNLPTSVEDAMITAEQVRAARSVLSWTARMLAEAADVSFSSIRRAEVDAHSVKPETLHKIRQALEQAGVGFIKIGDELTSITFRSSGQTAAP